jgi:hypothetical protein
LCRSVVVMLWNWHHLFWALWFPYNNGTVQYMIITKPWHSFTKIHWGQCFLHTLKMFVHLNISRPSLTSSKLNKSRAYCLQASNKGFDNATGIQLDLYIAKTSCNFRCLFICCPVITTCMCTLMIIVI